MVRSTMVVDWAGGADAAVRGGDVKATARALPPHGKLSVGGVVIVAPAQPGMAQWLAAALRPQRDQFPAVAKRHKQPLPVAGYPITIF